MTTIHLVRGLYIIVSLAVTVCAVEHARRSRGIDVVTAFALAGFALAIATSQIYSFNLKLTVATAYVGFGVASGALWLVAIINNWRKRS